MKRKYSGFAAAAVSVAAIAMTMLTGCGKKENKEAAAEADSSASLIEEVAAAEAESDSLDTAQFLELTKHEAGEVKSTESGLKYVVIKEGEGKQPSATSTVTVHYTGRLLDGTVFDSSVDRGEPASFPLDRVIPGWTEGLQLMKEGGKYEFFIPSNLAYGQQGVPGTIPPDSPLVFTVELIKVE